MRGGRAAVLLGVGLALSAAAPAAGPAMEFKDVAGELAKKTGVPAKTGQSDRWTRRAAAGILKYNTRRPKMSRNANPVRVHCTCCSEAEAGSVPSVEAAAEAAKSVDRRTSVSAALPGHTSVGRVET